MQPHHAVDRPDRSGRVGDASRAKGADLGDRRGELFGDGGEPIVQGGFDGYQARFSAIEAADTAVGRSDRHATEGVGLFAQFADRCVVNLAQRRPLLLDDPFKGTQPFGRVLMQAIFRGAERRHALFELAHGARLPLAGAAPLGDDAGHLMGEIREAVLGRLELLLLVAPQLERHSQPVELRLQFAEALVDAGDVLIHLDLCWA